MTVRKVHVMLDLETMSTRGDAAIVEIGAIAFDPETGEEVTSGREESFVTARFRAYVSVFDGHVDPRTVAWWLQQKAALALGEGMASGDCLVEALQSFQGWFAALGDVSAVWSHGATFDTPILALAFERHGMRAPWHYRTPRDTRTLYDLAPGGMPDVEKDPTREHGALYDCEVQIKQVVGALKALRSELADGVDCPMFTEAR
jgi:hypothetical protein